jgi:hypothetical protein
MDRACSKHGRIETHIKYFIGQIQIEESNSNHGVDERTVSK